VIGGAALYRGLKLLTEGGVPAGMLGGFLAGTVASGVTGAVAVWGVLRLVRTRSFTPFVLYRLVVGGVVLALTASGAR
jgi:undecaprenyl-diphosphatase